jgi:hypothetical protein
MGRAIWRLKFHSRHSSHLCPSSVGLESNAIALQVADTLDSYEATLDAWLVEPGNLVLYAKMSSQIEAARMMSSSALPSASGALAELLLAHTDLTFIVLKKHMVRRGELTEAHEEKLAKAKKRPTSHSPKCVRFASG